MGNECGLKTFENAKMETVTCPKAFRNKDGHIAFCSKIIQDVIESRTI